MRINIEKMIYGGEGLGRLPADSSGRGKAVFLPFVLAGESLEATLTEQKSGFARGKVEAVLEPSAQRVQAACPHYGSCGGCHYQHATYEHQLEIKKEILRETLKRTTKLDLPVEIQVHPSPPWNYRNRSRLQVQTTPAFAVGYFKISSHQLLAVEECPISSPLINRGIAELWRSGRGGKVPAGVREVEFFANADDSQLLVEVICTAESRRAAVRTWGEELQAAMPQIAGITLIRPSDKNSPAAHEKFLSLGADHFTYQTKKFAYKVSAGSFFQINRHLIDKLIEIVTSGATGEFALDLYAGVGLFSTALVGDIRHIVSVESSQTSAADLAYNLSSNGEAVQASAEQYLARAENSGHVRPGGALPHSSVRPDLAVVDPPRSGLGERVARSLLTLGAPRVVYVSCDPATLARDLVILLGGGYRIEQIHMIDLFPQTFHLETVVHLVR